MAGYYDELNGMTLPGVRQKTPISSLDLYRKQSFTIDGEMINFQEIECNKEFLFLCLHYFFSINHCFGLF